MEWMDNSRYKLNHSKCFCAMLSLKPFIIYRLHLIQSLLGNERTGMKEIMDGEIYVWQSCVQIEGYSITSSSPRSKCRTAELLFFVPLSSGSQLVFTGTFTLWSSLSFTSSLNSVPSTTPLPSHSHSFVPKSLWAASRRDLPLISRPSPIFSDFLFLH